MNKSGLYQLTGHTGIDVYRSARAGDNTTVQRILEEAVADAGSTDHFYTPNKRDEVMFELWAQAGNPCVLDLLAPFGIQWTPRSSICWGKLYILQGLLANNTDDYPSRDIKGRTLLHYALSAGQIEISDWLLSKGIDITDPTDYYVWAATLSRTESVIRYTASKGAPVDGSEGQRTALHHECNHGWTGLVPCLLSLGANPNAPDPCHFHGTALHLAAQRGNAIGLMRLLLNARGDPHVRDDKGRTPLDIAQASSVPRVADLLREWVCSRQ